MSTYLVYFMPRGLGIVYIVYLYLHSLYNLLSFFHRVGSNQVSITNNLQTDLFDP